MKAGIFDYSEVKVKFRLKYKASHKKSISMAGKTSQLMLSTAVFLKNTNGCGILRFLLKYFVPRSGPLCHSFKQKTPSVLFKGGLRPQFILGCLTLPLDEEAVLRVFPSASYSQDGE